MTSSYHPSLCMCMASLRIKISVVVFWSFLMRRGDGMTLFLKLHNSCPLSSQIMTWQWIANSSQEYVFNQYRENLMWLTTPRHLPTRVGDNLLTTPLHVLDFADLVHLRNTLCMSYYDIHVIHRMEDSPNLQLFLPPNDRLGPNSP